MCQLALLRSKGLGPSKVLLSFDSVGQLTNALSVVSLSKTIVTNAMLLMWYKGINNAFRIPNTFVIPVAWL